MNYPVWDLTTYGGGFLIALIAVVHVLVSHFAVGGGLFLVTLEKKAYRDEDSALLDYVKKHSKFFMLLTMVFGGMTGVGIWWTIALLNPAATSSLIHTFVFGWAAEWVFFVGEIVALFIYYYTFGKMDRKNHLLIGWIYFVCAWMSLFLINGIIDFMLTPGAWLENQNFWSGFFNPTFWPSLVFRTGLSLVLCGVFGFVTAAFLKNNQLREKLMRTCAAWAALPFGLMLVGGWWYIQALPELPKTIIFEKSPEIGAYLTTLGWFMPMLLIASVVMALRMPQGLQKYLCFVVLAISLIYFGAFEFVREAGRRPYVIYQHMYANQVYVADAPQLQQSGFLASAKWTEHKQLGDENRLEVGRDLFRFQCSACHSVGGLLNDIVPQVKEYDTLFAMDSKLSGLGLSPYMPPFFGSAEERAALAEYIVVEINGIDLKQPANPAVDNQEMAVEIPVFEKTDDSYVLLAWSSVGMRMDVDSRYWTLRPSGNDLFAQLVKRGDSPEIITDGVELRYQLEHGGLQGTMRVDDGHRAFIAEQLQYDLGSTVGYVPYPLVTLTAVDSGSGQVLASTRSVLPVSSEVGCKNCHDGDWQIEIGAGISDQTSLDILVKHDRVSGTDLVAQAEAGEKVECSSCHADSMGGSEGDAQLLNLSAAIHGWHAPFLRGMEGMDACVTCHPARPDGPTQALRSHHGQFMDCSNCHGSMEDHSISLLMQEQSSGKPGAAVLLAELSPSAVDSLEQINPRSPWVNQPDCLNCHEEFEMGSSVDAFNTWTEDADGLFRNRHDQMEAMMCAACHSSPHAVYPAVFNRLGEQRDSIQPLQYQGNDRPIGNDCTVCHTVQPEFEGHHPNSLRL